MPITIRHWNQEDNVSVITSLLHRAYGELADLGFRYHATWQSEEVTFDRLSRGIAFIAEDQGEIVGTATLYLPPSKTGCAWYDQEDVARFGQFGVEPTLQRKGIGSLLLDAIETTSISRGVFNLALDTAEEATHLIELYSRRGYKYVCDADWEITNYRSVIMNKRLARGSQDSAMKDQATGE